MKTAERAGDAARTTSILLAKAILSRDPNEIKTDPEDDEPEVSPRDPQAAAKLFPDARSPVELAFAAIVGARITAAVPLPDRYLFEPKWLRCNLDELFAVFAENAALEFVDRRRRGPIRDPLPDISTDVLLFEVAAWFLASLDDFIRTSGSIPEAHRRFCGILLSNSAERVGSIFEDEGGWSDGTTLLRTRMKAYPEGNPISQMEFFLAAVGENRGHSQPSEVIRGDFVPPSWDEGVFSQLVLLHTTMQFHPSLSVLFDLVKRGAER